MDIHRLNGKVKVGSLVRVHHPGFVDKHGKKFQAVVKHIDPSCKSPYTVWFVDSRSHHSVATLTAKDFTLEKE